MTGSHAIRSRPFGATQHSWSNEQLGGASEDARSYWQGRFAACALVERFWHTGRPWNSWGVAPNPTRGAASGLRKGHCPLTLFLPPGLSAFLINRGIEDFPAHHPHPRAARHRRAHPPHPVPQTRAAAISPVRPPECCYAAADAPSHPAGSPPSPHRQCSCTRATG